MTCPEFDIDGQQTCIQALESLYQAYASVLGGGRARVRMGTRWSEYHAGHPEPLRQLYMTLYAQCNFPEKVNLPDLSVSPIRRGPPAHGHYPVPYSNISGAWRWRWR